MIEFSYNKRLDSDREWFLWFFAMEVAPARQPWRWL
jgi:hypothetical protein